MLIRILLLFMVCTVSGCGGGGENFSRIDVSGEVSISGVPLKAGKIMFTGVEGTTVANSMALVADRKFKTAPNMGPSAGKYNVVIVAFGDGPVGEDGDPPLLGSYREEKTISADQASMSFSIEKGDLVQ
ncbi:MAG: hypothetical protein R3C49_24920 [Planctomycetaceae bacterium]